MTGMLSVAIPLQRRCQALARGRFWAERPFCAKFGVGRSIVRQVPGTPRQDESSPRCRCALRSQAVSRMFGGRAVPRPSLETRTISAMNRCALTGCRLRDCWSALPACGRVSTADQWSEGRLRRQYGRRGVRSAIVFLVGSGDRRAGAARQASVLSGGFALWQVERVQPPDQSRLWAARDMNGADSVVLVAFRRGARDDKACGGNEKK